MYLPKPGNYTVRDIRSLPYGQRAELIDGQIYYMPLQSMRHKEIITKLIVIINDLITKNKQLYRVLPSPSGVFLNKNSKNYFEPDISVVCDQNKIKDKGCVGAPDWIIEAALSSSYQTDYYIKLFKYHSIGVREYWIVDCTGNTVHAYDFEHGNFKKYTFNDKASVGIFDGWEIDFSQIKF